MELIRERKGIEKRFYDLCVDVVSRLGLELYDLDYYPGNGELKVYIMNQATRTATIDDCVNVDHALTPFIDSLDWMPEKLTLEVSSPGLYRSLREMRHFKESLGEFVQLTLVQPLEGQFPAIPKNWAKSKKIRGKIIASLEQQIEITDGSTNAYVPFDLIRKANIDPDFQELLSKEVKS